MARDAALDAIASTLRAATRSTLLRRDPATGGDHHTNRRAPRRRPQRSGPMPPASWRLLESRIRSGAGGAGARATKQSPGSGRSLFGCEAAIRDEQHAAGTCCSSTKKATKRPPNHVKCSSRARALEIAVPSGARLSIGLGRGCTSRPPRSHPWPPTTPPRRTSTAAILARSTAQLRPRRLHTGTPSIAELIGFRRAPASRCSTTEGSGRSSNIIK